MLTALLALLAAAAPPTEATGSQAAEPPALAARRGLAEAALGARAIAEVQAAASRCADPIVSAGSSSRRRIAALLPRLTAEVHFDERSYRVVGLQGAGEVDYSRFAPGRIIGVRATWDLAGLLSSPADRIEGKGALDLARRRDEAVRKATALYFERRRLRLALALEPPAAANDRAEAELEIERLAAELDALTRCASEGATR